MNELDGVGLLKIGTDIHNVSEFYVVIIDGDLHQQKFKSYSLAERYWLLRKALKAQHGERTDVSKLARA